MPEPPLLTPSSGERLALSDFIRRYRAELLARWSREVRSLPVASHLSQPRLVDHIPDLLDRIAAMLAPAGAEEEPDLEDLPSIHALERLDEGFGLEVVTAEYSLLRRCVLRAYGEHLGGLLPVDEVARFDAAIDEAVNVSVAKYAKARERTLVALDRISEAALESGDLNLFLSRLLRVILETTEPVDSAAIFLCEDGRLGVRAAVGMEESLSSDFSVAVGEGFVGTVAHNRRPLELHSAATDPLVRSQLLKSHGTRALYGVPLLEAGELIGVATMGSRTAFEFSTEDKLLFRTMTSRASSLILQTRLRERERAERERAERALAVAEESLAQVDALLSTAPSGIAFLDRELRYLQVNDALARSNRRSVSAHLGRPVREVVPRLASWLEPLLRQVMTTGEPVRAYEFSAEAPDEPGPPRHWLADFFPVRGRDGHSYGVGAMLFDITDRKREEEERERLLREVDRQRRLLDAILRELPVGVAIADPTGRLVLGNAAIERIWRRSFEPSPDIAGYRVYSGFHPDGRPLAPEEWPIARALQRAETVQDEEIEILRGDGARGVTLQSAVPIRDARGELIAAVVTLLDITERKQAEQEERRTAQFRESFLGIVSHDLRSPLNTIALSASFLLKEGSLAERHLRAVARIAKSADRMQRMIRDLLDFTRGRLGGGIPVAPQPGNLRHLCRHVVEELEVAYPTRDIQLQAEGDFQGEWDPDRIIQVLQNLGNNALAYSPESSPVVFTLRNEGPNVRLEVSNRGEPIAPELLAALFEPFRRGGEAAASNTAGLGLGLYIVRQIIRGHGGTIEARSTREEGTTFTVTLPRHARGAAGGPGGK